MGISKVEYDTPASVTASTLTGSYATLLATTDDYDALVIMSTSDATWKLSIDGGSSDFLIFPASTSLILDARTNDHRFPKGTISVKHNGVAPVSGIITVQVIRGG